MEAPGAGATMTLEVDFQTPGQEGTHHLSMPIGGSLVVTLCDAWTHAVSTWFVLLR